jgi:hypothetical protein
MPGLARLALLPPLLALAACGTTSLSDKLAGPDRVRGDADAVRIYQAGSQADAFPLAIGHCARFSRSAQFDRRGEDGAYVFRCVPG